MAMEREQILKERSPIFLHYEGPLVNFSLMF